MNDRLVICSVILFNYAGGIFGMDLACKSKKELSAVFAGELANYEIKISDKNSFNTLTHYDSILTITDDRHDIRYLYKGGGGRIPEEEKWMCIPISKVHLSEMALKSKVFYLYAYEKGACEKDYDPRYCTKIVQIIIQQEKRSICIQLEDFDKRIGQKTYWTLPSAMAIVGYGIPFFIALCRVGWLERCSQFFNTIWLKTMG